jgi:lysine decarboxylase
MMKHMFDQRKTPLFDALLEYYNNNIISFHVPGHKKGNGMQSKFKEFVGLNVLSIDLTLTNEVDSLHNSKGVIKHAQELAAEAYNAEYSLFCVHGTTGAVQAMIMSVVGEGEKIIVPRNAHNSCNSGIILSGAVPVYIEPEIDENLGIALNVTPEAVEKALKENNDAKAVLVVNPTYWGIAADIEKIVNIVHSYKIPIIVDEAHGGHFHFSDELPVSAVNAGADIAAQSTHKMVGSMTQSSMLHVSGKHVCVDTVKKNLYLLHTTSPSYVLLASLDVARAQMVSHGKELIDNAIDMSEYARKAINAIDGYYCFGHEVVGKKGAYGFDPMKISINCLELGLTGYQLEHILSNEYYIQPELWDLCGILCVVSFGNTREDVDRLICALRAISKKYWCINKQTKKNLYIPLPYTSRQVLTPREAYQSKVTSVPIKDSVGKISAEFVIAYPPGISALNPGELVTKEIVEYIISMKSVRASIYGMKDQNADFINVIA